MNCEECNFNFDSVEDLEDHLLGFHVNLYDENEAIRNAKDYIFECYRDNFCPLCDETFGTKSSHLDEHFIQYHPDFYEIGNFQRGEGNPAVPIAQIQFTVTSSSHNGTMKKYSAKLDNKIEDLNTLFSSSERAWKEIIKTELGDKKNIKVHLFMK